MNMGESVADLSKKVKQEFIEELFQRTSNQPWLPRIRRRLYALGVKQGYLKVDEHKRSGIFTLTGVLRQSIALTC